MKLRLLAAVLAVSAFSYAQSATPAQSTSPQPSTTPAPAATKAECPCCQKMSDEKTPMSCCAHHQDNSAHSEMPCCKGKDGKEAMSCSKGKDGDKTMTCCQGKHDKDAMSSMNADKDKSVNAPSSPKKSCGGEGKASCCSQGN